MSRVISARRRSRRSGSSGGRLLAIAASGAFIVAHLCGPAPLLLSSPPSTTTLLPTCQAQLLRSLFPLGGKNGGGRIKLLKKDGKTASGGGGGTPPAGGATTTKKGYFFGGVGAEASEESGKLLLMLPSVAIGVVCILLSMAVTTAFWNKSSSIRHSRVSSGDESSDEEEEEVVTTIDHPPKGVLARCEVEFEDIRMTLKPKKKKLPDRVILDGSISGVAKPGRMLAVMGPSGSGKTTVIHALAGRIKYSKKIKVYGKRYINEIPIPGEDMIPSAFIEQDVEFFPHMTVKETLDFRVELKLGRTVSKSDKDKIVRELMDLLALTKSANTIVGNLKIRGISGGERKRLSIACEMIDSPPIIFLDEPTSGLDSYQAEQVVQTMRRLADSGKTVVAVIHQPSQRVFSLFDDLLLLSDGRQMYFGEVKHVRSYFESIGHGCAREVGTAEHILDVVSSTQNGGQEELHRRLDEIAEHSARRVQHVRAKKTESKEAKKMRKTLDRFTMKAHGRPATRMLQQFNLLFKRSMKETLRGKGVILIKLLQQVTVAVVYGGIYNLGTNQASIMDRFGLLSLITIGTMNMAVAGTIRSFPKEKAIVKGEMTSKLYRTLPYFIAKAISEIPLIGFYTAVFGAIIYPMVGLQPSKFKNFIGLTSLHAIASEAAGLFLGAVSPNSDVALALFPPLIVLSVIFDGRNISKENTPKYLRWLTNIGLVRWGYTGLAVNEFEGLQFDTSGPYRGPPLKTGQDALDRFGIGDTTLRKVVRAETILISASWFLSFVGLALTKEKFEVMRSPTDNNNHNNSNK